MRSCFFAILENPPGREGGWIPPVGACANTGEKYVHGILQGLFTGLGAPVINVKTQMRSETQALSGGLQITP